MNFVNLPQNNIGSGFRYITKGIGILLQPGMKRFVLVPIAANCIVFVALTLYMLGNFTAIQAWLSGLLPDWQLLAYVIAFISGLFIFLIMLIYGYSFTLLTNIIAAPFYGMLAEKIEQQLTGEKIPEEPVSHLVTRTLKREMIKLWYFISRGFLVMIGLFFLAFIPIVQLLVPILALLWAAWVMTLQYIDYSADNNQLPFKSMRSRLGDQRFSSVGFGGVIMLCSMIPVVNIFIMPVSVAGGTLFWINELRQDLLANNNADQNNI